MNKSRLKSRAYRQGCRFYWYGGQDNPYEPGTIAHDDWQAGWEAAVEEDRPKRQEEKSSYVEEDVLNGSLRVVVEGSEGHCYAFLESSLHEVVGHAEGHSIRSAVNSLLERYE